MATREAIMSNKKKSVAAALALTAASATAAWIVKRRSDSHRPYAGLYFEDGSMVSLPGQSPQARELVELGIEAVGMVRSG
jgi:hypothetical protein